MDNEYIREIEESISKVAAEKPDAKIIIISGGKTPEQIRIIIETAKKYHLVVSTESHDDIAKVLTEYVQASTEVMLSEKEAIKRLSAEMSRKTVKEASRDRDNNIRYQKEQMKLRRRFFRKK